MRNNKIAVLLLALFLWLVPAQAIFAQDLDVAGSAALLMEASTGQILYEKNADQPLPPASITKLMTLLVAFEALEKGLIEWDETVVASEAAWRMGGSEMFLDVNQEVTVGELITGISVVSANDGCIALAEHLYGSEEAFVRVMNERAAELGLTQSSFRNSTGIPAPGHMMSARDIAVLARHLINTFPKILEIESQRELTFNDIRQFNRNPLLGRFPGADGLKTGWTDEAGYCLVGTAQQDGLRMISVVLGAANEEERFVSSRELLNYGFRNFRMVTVAGEQDVVGEVEVRDGREKSVKTVPKQEVRVLVPIGREDDLETVVRGEETLTAPLEAGTTAGTLEVRLDNRVLAVEEVVTASEVQRAGFFARLFRAIARFLSGLLSRRG